MLRYQNIWNKIYVAFGMQGSDVGGIKALRINLDPTDGDGHWDGSYMNPYKTIEKAVEIRKISKG